MSRKNTHLSDGQDCPTDVGSRPCPKDMLSEPLKQATAMIKAAEKVLKRGHFPACMVSLETAKQALASAKKSKDSSDERRKTIVIASFHAGQAFLCPMTSEIRGRVTPYVPRKRVKKEEPALEKKDDEENA